MKTKLSILTVLAVSTILMLSGCAKDGRNGTNGTNGLDGNANVIYSPWYTPTAWSGTSGDWYFDISNSAISHDIVEGGVILAYVSLPGDIYDKAVRPIPAYALGCNWDYLIPYYGKIEFLCDAVNMPGTSNYFFRFILIPANTALKSTTGNKYPSAEELRKMSYIEICKKFGIPE